MPSVPFPPSPPPPRPDEVDGLLGFLEWQRHGIRYALDGITNTQARLTPIPSTTLSLGGLLKHVVATERSWIRTDVERGEEEPRTDEFTLGADETVAQWLAAWEVEAAHTEEVVRSGIDLDQEVPTTRAARRTTCAGCCCTWWRRWPATPATQTCCARRSTAGPTAADVGPPVRRSAQDSGGRLGSSHERLVLAGPTGGRHAPRATLDSLG